MLARENEQGDADNIETAGQRPEDGYGTIEFDWRTSRKDRNGRRQERSHTRDGSDPGGRAACLVYAEVEASKTHASQCGRSNSFGMAGLIVLSRCLRSRDEPNGQDGEGKAQDR